ncbi:hypothetical protein HDU97_005091 [Phlyctochytrium planicorne]|nr:hypothetical protein HDU97_005091 [Phlyctochytrium planicorne]
MIAEMAPDNICRSGRLFDGHEETFSDAVAQVFAEFLSGQYDSLIRMLEYLQSIHPDVKISKDKAHQIFGNLREFMLWSGDCWGAAKFEVIKLYEMQQRLNDKSYFDFAGRWRASAEISQGMLSMLLKVVASGRGVEAKM